MSLFSDNAPEFYSKLSPHVYEFCYLTLSYLVRRGENSAIDSCCETILMLGGETAPMKRNEGGGKGELRTGVLRKLDKYWEWLRGNEVVAITGPSLLFMVTKTFSLRVYGSRGTVTLVVEFCLNSVPK